MNIFEKMNVKEELRGLTWEDGYGRGYNSALEQIEKYFERKNIINNKRKKREWKDLIPEQKLETGKKYIKHIKKMEELPLLVEQIEYFINILEPDIGCCDKYVIIKTPTVPINATRFFDKYKTGMVESWKNDFETIFMFIPFDEWNKDIENRLSKYIDWDIIKRSSCTDAETKTKIIEYGIKQITPEVLDENL